MTVVHIWAFHTTGNNNPTGVPIRTDDRDDEEGHGALPWPYYTIKDLYALVLFLILFVAFVFFMPNYLGHPDNYIEANPLATPAHIVPEWYFLPFYAMLRAIDVFDILFIDSEARRCAGDVRLDRGHGAGAVARHEPGPLGPLPADVAEWYFWLLVADFFILMWAGGQPAEGLVPTHLADRHDLLVRLLPRDPAGPRHHREAPSRNRTRSRRRFDADHRKRPNPAAAMPSPPRPSDADRNRAKGTMTMSKKTLLSAVGAAVP